MRLFLYIKETHSTQLAFQFLSDVSKFAKFDSSGNFAMDD
jgi:hypothetical protein